MMDLTTEKLRLDLATDERDYGIYQYKGQEYSEIDYGTNRNLKDLMWELVDDGLAKYDEINEICNLLLDRDIIYELMQRPEINEAVAYLEA